MKPLHMALVAVAAALVVGVSTFLLIRNDDKPSASQPTSTSLTSSPGEGWTEEEMRNARPRDTVLGPSVETLVIGGATLAGVTTVAVLLLVRRRSSSR